LAVFAAVQIPLRLGPPDACHLLPDGKLNLEHTFVELRFGLLDIRASGNGIVR